LWIIVLADLTYQTRAEANGSSISQRPREPVTCRKFLSPFCVHSRYVCFRVLGCATR